MTGVRLSKLSENGEETASLNEKDPKALEESLPLNGEEKKGEEEKGEEEKKNGFNWSYYLRYISLIVLVVQNTSQVLLMRYAAERNQTKFLKTVAVFFNEVFKLVASTVLFFISTGSFKESLKAFKHHFFDDFMDTIKVSVPALIYTVQNFLLYVAIDHLDAATYMVTYQLKILTTAMFTVLMLKRRLSYVQWLSLCVLIGGVALVQINAGDKAKKEINATDSTTIAPTTVSPSLEDHNQPWIGLIAVLIACVLSGFAGIYFEKILKGSKVSIWMRNIQLASLSLPISLIMAFAKDYTKIQDNGFMQGFDYIVWIIVAIQAFGGLVVAVVIKYADNILKAFATSVAIIVAAVASIFIFKIWPALMFIAGAVLVIGAVVLYSVFPYRAPQSQVVKKTSAA